MIWEDSENLEVHNEKTLFHEQAYFYDDITAAVISIDQINFNSDKAKVGLAVTITNTGIVTAHKFVGMVTALSDQDDGTEQIYASPPLYNSVGSQIRAASLRLNKNLIPTANNTFDIGNAEYKIRDLYEDPSSDERIKEDIVPFTGGLNFVNQIPVVSFTFKDIDYNENTRGKRETGFIAQDVKKALDNSDYESYRLWSENPGSYQGVDRRQMIPALTAAIQELSKKVDTIEKRLDKLT
tara:strand:- start:5769 stop:6485 length:717 start_codon:yes stop_codon:yes gene_type:complete